MNGCTFCDIAAGRATASIVYRDDRVTAFLDHNPVTPGHLMVIPNEANAAAIRTALRPDD